MILRIFLYNLLLLGLSPVLLIWFLYQLLFVPRRRAGFTQRLGKAPTGKGVIWVHAVSVGEVRAVSPMLEILKEETGREVYLSTVTPTGQATARRECSFVDRIFYFPLDLPLLPGLAIDRASPAIFVTAETEFWPNFYRACFLRNIPVMVVNGRISDKSMIRYRQFRWFFAPLLAEVKAFLMQSDEDARRVIEIGAQPDRVTVTGNTKYDRKAEIADLPPAVESWAAENFTMVAGSTHAGEEELLLDCLRQDVLDGMTLALVPRHPERFDEVAELLDSSELTWCRFSRVVAGGSCSGRVMLVDAMGVLESFYRAGNAAFVGGSLVDIGGHNLLEPAMLGKPVLTGPFVSNFRDIAAVLTESGGCRIVSTQDELVDAAARLITDGSLHAQMSAAALSSSTATAGASRRNVDKVFAVLEDLRE
jgi:3-deoxy-D-manno-octulosonic-acid transferase